MIYSTLLRLSSPLLHHKTRAPSCIVVSMDPLEALRLATTDLREREVLAARRNELLAQARDAGASWEDITLVTGLSRQAAYNAYQRAKAARAATGR